MTTKSAIQDGFCKAINACSRNITICLTWLLVSMTLLGTSLAQKALNTQTIYRARRHRVSEADRQFAVRGWSNQ